MDSMKAIGFQRYGSAEVLELLELPKPIIAPSSVLIRVGAAGVNPADWQIRNGRFRLVIRASMPFIPGADVAGIVEEVGSAVTRFQIGEPVYAMLPLANGGGYAEYAPVDEDLLAAIPSTISLIDAASIPLAALTALQALRDRAKVQVGFEVLINGASGGVGLFAIQIAKILGARVMAVSSERNANLVRSAGADSVRNYTREAIPGGQARYDVIFDTRNNHPFWQWEKILRPQGVLVSVNPALKNPVTRLLFGLKGHRVESLLVQPSGKDLETISTWITSGQIRPIIDKQYPLTDAIAAHKYSETARARGKLVLVVDENLSV